MKTDVLFFSSNSTWMLFHFYTFQGLIHWDLGERIKYIKRWEGFPLKAYQIPFKQLSSKCYHWISRHPEMMTQISLDWYTITARYLAIVWQNKVAERNVLLSQWKKKKDKKQHTPWFLLKTSIKSKRISNVPQQSSVC